MPFVLEHDEFSIERTVSLTNSQTTFLIGLTLYYPSISSDETILISNAGLFQ